VHHPSRLVHWWGWVRLGWVSFKALSLSLSSCVWHYLHSSTGQQQTVFARCKLSSLNSALVSWAAALAAGGASCSWVGFELPSRKHGAHTVAHWAPAVLSWWHVGGRQGCECALAHNLAGLLCKELFSWRIWRAWYHSHSSVGTWYSPSVLTALILLVITVFWWPIMSDYSLMVTLILMMQKCTSTARKFCLCAILNLFLCDFEWSLRQEVVSFITSGVMNFG